MTPVNWAVGVAIRGASGHLTAARPLVLPHPSHWRAERCCGCGRSSVSTEAGFSRLITPPAQTSAMSSLLLPFSVGEGPRESCGVRRRCPSSAARQQPPPRRLAAAAPADLGGLPAHQLSYAAKRNLAAAAVGGRKMTHPGKAILAGWLLLLPIVVAVQPEPRSVHPISDRACQQRRYITRMT